MMKRQLMALSLIMMSSCTILEGILNEPDDFCIVSLKEERGFRTACTIKAIEPQKNNEPDGTSSPNSISKYNLNEPHPKPNNQRIREANIQTYTFKVEIVSGRLEGQSFSGSFSYDEGLLTRDGREAVAVKDFQFSFLNGEFHRDNMSGGIPYVLTYDGEFKDIAFVGTPPGPGNGFGLNIGFGRNQFGRSSEAFINQGNTYFGYLDEATFVDGAGQVSYFKNGSLIVPKPTFKTTIVVKKMFFQRARI